ncbi:bile acid:sodium symporter family protein [Phenylobacterium sp.]|uniref:bile acid:sodium symporter family protein n=1 Tax=Phenylobacterium sp. TaxID=1871053 RepID=UPI002724EE85|nr:bile acid:sodium symporter family protein [Phenylobacterium sp.]MDO8379462.1 bile acid:sodium symporter family protein [Phenylobacterium sp.]
MAGLLSRLKPDWYIILIVSMVVLASILPARGAAAPAFGLATKIAIALVFFLHGAKLSREAVIKGVTHWRLHLLILAATFVLFPVLCLGLAALPGALTPAALAPGLIFLGCLPSTIQSSIGFTAVARGNVAATVASATASNLLGIALTPLLAAMLMHTQGGFSLHSAQSIVLQLLLPFIAGQVLRPWVGPWISARAKAVGYVDRGSILLVVYSAFSEAVVQGIWTKVGALDLVRLLILCVVLLAAVLLATLFAARALRFNKEDEITIVFCGSKKSLASGVPMAGVLFPGATLGLILLPIMIFHQIQLMACAVIAGAYAKRADSDAQTS